MGGFCLIEYSDVDIEDDGTEIAPRLYADPNTGLETDEVQNNTNRFIQTYRPTAAQFSAMETDWTDLGASEFSGMIDGRNYAWSI